VYGLMQSSKYIERGETLADVITLHDLVSASIVEPTYARVAIISVGFLHFIGDSVCIEYSHLHNRDKNAGTWYIASSFHVHTFHVYNVSDEALSTS
jgi:hypothetical protein